MSTSGDVRAIRERSMQRMLAERDPDKAAAYALAGLWDAVELLTHALDAEDGVDRQARAELERLVRSLPVRLATAEDDALATAAVAGHLADVVALPARARWHGDAGVRRRRCGA